MWKELCLVVMLYKEDETEIVSRLKLIIFHDCLQFLYFIHICMLIVYKLLMDMNYNFGSGYNKSISFGNKMRGWWKRLKKWHLNHECITKHVNHATIKFHYSSIIFIPSSPHILCAYYWIDFHWLQRKCLLFIMISFDMKQYI